MVRTEAAPQDLGVVIRPVREEELLNVMTINRICLPENYSYSFFYSLFKSNPESFLVAEVDGKITGYVMSRVEWGSSKMDTLRLRKLGHIVSIAVLPEYRGRGIGRALMREVLNALRNVYGCDEVYLEVRVTNTQAINLYHSLGFKVTKVAKSYYVDGEDAYVMAIKF
ncbi:MAG: ribosomal protein S18-alanine N-acetyltransferase [Nitrososphaerota archaeon]|nr:ribosomal protein S18-alanine N-acetyltransferase [Candidatus Calditenuaceae archaeon]MDW8073862.1 ribosomal protein S18-alanine N-acetyltransferase [Nitrososphaerota archaeon]